MQYQSISQKDIVKWEIFLIIRTLTKLNEEVKRSRFGLTVCFRSIKIIGPYRCKEWLNEFWWFSRDTSYPKHLWSALLSLISINKHHSFFVLDLDGHQSLLVRSISAKFSTALIIMRKEMLDNFCSLVFIFHEFFWSFFPLFFFIYNCCILIS